MMTMKLVSLDTLRERERERELTFSKINNKFNINKKLKDSDKSLRN